MKATRNEAQVTQRVDFQTETIVTPGNCVNCRQPASTTINVECSSGVDLILFKVWRWHDFEFPVCSWCKRRRQTVGTLGIVFAVLAAIGWIMSMFVFEGFVLRFMPRELWLCMVLVGFFAAAYFARNLMTSALDAWLLGVCGVRLTKQGVATLWFRDDELANEIKAMNR